MHNAGWKPAPGDARVVDEDVLISLVGGYEPVTLILRKPLHRSLGHCLCARLSLLLGSPVAENPPSTSAASIPTSRRTSENFYSTQFVHKQECSQECNPKGSGYRA